MVAFEYLTGITIAWLGSTSGDPMRSSIPLKVPFTTAGLGMRAAIKASSNVPICGRISSDEVCGDSCS